MPMPTTTDMLMSGSSSKAQIPSLGFPVESFFGSNVAVPAGKATGAAPLNGASRMHTAIIVLVMVIIGYALWHWNYSH